MRPTLSVLLSRRISLNASRSFTQQLRLTPDVSAPRIYVRLEPRAAHAGHCGFLLHSAWCVAPDGVLTLDYCRLAVGHEGRLSQRHGHAEVGVVGRRTIDMRPTDHSETGPHARHTLRAEADRAVRTHLAHALHALAQAYVPRRARPI